MTQLPLLTLEQSLKLYKDIHSDDPSFGMNTFEENFESGDFVILENSGEAQSSPYLRCEYYILILSLKGDSIRYINQHKYEIQAQSLQLIVPGTIHSFKDISENQDSYLILFNRKFLSKEVNELLKFHKEHPRQIDIKGCEFEHTKYVFEQINYEYKNKQPEYEEVVKTLLTQILLILKRRKLCVIENKIENRAQQILNQYLELIEQHYQTKRLVSDYANLLDLTPKHLSETVKEITNKTALTFIHIRILKELRYLLIYTKLSVKQITSLLNFENSSDLGRFFKKHEGISPSKYRLSFQNQ